MGRAWTDEGDFALGDALTQLAPMIELHAQRHLAYPVLHFFHSRHVREAVAPRLAAPQEALLMISAQARHQGAAAPNAVHITRCAVGGMLGTLDTAFIHEGDAVPPLHTDPSDENQDASRQAAANHETRRRLLLAFVQDGDGHGQMSQPPVTTVKCNDSHSGGTLYHTPARVREQKIEEFSPLNQPEDNDVYNHRCTHCRSLYRWLPSL